MEESTWRKHVSWNDPEEFEAKYEMISSKVDNALKPFSISDFTADPSQGKDFSKSKISNESLKKELNYLSGSQKPSTPSKNLQKKHEKISNEIKDMQKQSNDLMWSDIITHPQVTEFMKRYFPRSYKILCSDFLSFLQYEYPHLVADDDVKDEIISMLTVDQNSEYISLNALQLSTRDYGLESFLQQLNTRLEDSFKESKAQINEQIIQEVTEIKEMLDSRSVELEKKEAKLLARENKILRIENTLATEFRDKLEKLASSTREKLMKDLNGQMKRLQGLERNVNDMIKLARSKQQVLTRSELSMKASGSENSSVNKFKARITSLEKSNEVLKTKLSILEMESKADKATISRLSEELNRVKARSSMLEVSLSSMKKPETEKIVEVPVMIKEEPEKKNIQKITGLEVLVPLSLMNTLLQCCQVTLPVLHMPSSPKSHKASVFEEDGMTLGELFFPAFNKIVPCIVECIPFIHKLKKKDEQSNLIKFFWQLLMYAWNEEFPVQADRRFNPNNLSFDPTTTVWKKKLSTIKAKASRRPLYPLFTNQTVHKILCSYLFKWMNSRDKANTELSLTSAFLIIVTSTSKKRIVTSLNYIKGIIEEHYKETDIKNCVTVLVALLDSPDDIGSLSCEILLGLTVDHLSDVLAQCSNEMTIFKITEACKRVLMSGMKTGIVSDLEEGMIVLLQKFSGNEYFQGLIKQQGISDVLTQRMQNVKNNTFFTSNVNSILRNIN